MTIIYRTQATAIGGLSGSAASSDGALRLALARPRELGGKGGHGTNPEQLFAAGYAACFLETLRLVSAERIADDANVTATVGIGPREDGRGMGFDVALDIDLPGVDEGEARRLIDAAHAVCPYSHAVRGNLDVRLSL